MTNRRDFIKSSFLAANGMLLFPGLSEASGISLPAPGGDPEKYWKDIRKTFPLKKDIVFLNNGTMGPSPYPVIERQYKTEMEVNNSVNYGGWYETGNVLAKFFNADKDEICLTRNVSEGINIICWGMNFKRGDEVIVSNHEHVGNALPWLNRARVDGLVVRVVDFNLTDDLLLEDIENKINSSTRLIALPHVPCTTGRIMPVKRIAEIARRKNVLYFIDGAHGAGMIDLNFAEIDCDFYASCTHKWMLGPKGTGFLYIKKEKLEMISPLFVGGYSDDGWNLLTNPPELKGFKQGASRNFYGTQNKSIYQGVNAAVEYYEEIGKQHILDRIAQLNNYLYQHLKKQDFVDIITPENARGGMLSFKLRGKDFVEFNNFCLKRQIHVRPVPENEVNCIRISTHIYNSFSDIDAFLATLQEFAKI